MTIASAILGSANIGLTKDGPGALILTSSNSTYSGGTYIYGGTLETTLLTNNGSNSPIGTANVTINGGATFRVNASTGQATNRIVTLGIGGGAIDASGAGTVTFNGTPNTRVGVDNYTEAVAGDGYSNLTLTGSGNGIMNGAILLLTPPASAGFFSNQTNTAVVEGFTQVTKNGPGTWTLNATNYWQGGTVINSGSLVLGNATDTLSNNGPVTINTNGTLDLLSNTDTVGQVRLYGGTIVASTGGGTLNGMSYDVQSGSISANLSGDLAPLIKSGPGTVTLSGTNTYQGATTVNGGTLIVSGSLSATSSASVGAGATMQVDGLVNSAATVAVAGTLKGTGSVGAVSVQNGGTLAPGHSPGVLTVTNGLAFSGPGASLSIVINSTTAGTGYSQVNVTGGAVNLNGATLNLTLNYTPALAVVSSDGNAFTSLGDTFNLVLGNAAGINGQFANTLAPSFSGGFNTITIGSQEYAINYHSDGGAFNDGIPGNQIALMAIPEPQTWVMLISGIGMLSLLRRRRS